MTPLEKFGRRRADRVRGGGAGFLLVEALAAMAIGAFIMIALGSTVAVMTRASDRSAGVSNAVEATTRALDAMSRDLRIASRARWAGQGAGFVFSGSPTGLVFARRVAETGDLRLIALAAEDTPRPRVTRSDSAFPPIARGMAEIPSGILSQAYAGELAVRFAYFSRLPTGEEALLDVWDVATEMPAAVRIAMVDIATGNLVSSIRVPLMIDAEPGCAAPSTAICSYVLNGEADAVGAADLPPEAVSADDPRGWQAYAR